MSPVLPRGRLLGIALAVLLLHLALLESMPASFSFDEPLQTRPFLTRSIAPTPVPALAPDARGKPGVLARDGGPETGKAMAKEKEMAAVAAPSLQSAPAPVPPAVARVPAPEVAASQAVAQTATAPLPSALPETPGPTIPSDKPAPPPSPAATAATVSGGAAAERPAATLVPASATLRYRVIGQYRGLPQTAAAELIWRQDGRSYEARLSIGILFRTRVQTSRGHIGAGGLLPLRFSDKTGSERAAHFERSTGGLGGQVIFSANSPPVALAPGAQDRLSVLLQLGAMLAAEPTRHPAGSSISMQVIGAREADVWVFKIDGADAVNIPYGQTPTMKLTRSPRREFDQKVEVWLAPAMGYLPVRVRVTEPNGNFLDQQLSSMETP